MLMSHAVTTLWLLQAVLWKLGSRILIRLQVGFRSVPFEAQSSGSSNYSVHAAISIVSYSVIQLERQ